MPTGPVVQQSAAAAKAPVRTYQDLLQNPHDEALFDFYFTSQLAILDTQTGTISPIGKPAIYDTISDSGVVWSPGGDYVLVMFIWEDVEWVATGAYPIMMDLSALTFNYFNPDLANEPRQGYGDVLEPEE